MDQDKRPRGIRNNNPGNIKAVQGVTWKGQTGVDEKGFVIFDTIIHGIRALCVVALRYWEKHGIRTLSAFGDRWAPPGGVPGSDNPGSKPGTYGQLMAEQIGVDPEAEFNIPDNLAAIAWSVTHNENGDYFYSGQEFGEGASMAKADLGYPV